MTNKEYGQWIATILSTLPGGMGMWGLLVAFDQQRIGPLILGLIFLLAAWWLAKTLIELAQKGN